MANKGTCKADSCDREVVGKGYCKRHFRLWKRGEMPKARYDTCVAEGCHRRVVKGMRCQEHQKVKPPAAEETSPASAPADAAPAAEEAPAES